MKELETVACTGCDGKGSYELHSDSAGVDYPAVCWQCNGTGRMPVLPKGLIERGRKPTTQKHK